MIFLNSIKQSWFEKYFELLVIIKSFVDSNYNKIEDSINNMQNKKNSIIVDRRIQFLTSLLKMNLDEENISDQLICYYSELCIELENIMVEYCLYNNNNDFFTNKTSFSDKFLEDIIKYIMFECS